MTERTAAETLDSIRIHDADTHLTEPPDLWTSRVSSKWGDAVPHVQRNPDTGVDHWFVRGHDIGGVCQLTSSPVGPGYQGPTPAYPPTLDEADPGAWQAEARLAHMDREGIYSQILYPNILGFIHSEILKLDPVLLLELVRAYNDYQTEFCSVDPNRLHPMTCVPWWDIDASRAELERCADFGHKGLLFAWEFERNGLPPLRSDHWEPLLKTAEEMRLPVSFHIGFGGSVLEDHHKLKLDERAVADKPADDRQKSLDMVAGASNGNMKNSLCITELIMGRICHRYPTLKFVSVESGMGYVPFMLEQLDYMFMNTSAHTEHPDMLLPSEYFKRQIYGTFWFESDASRLVDLYPENFMFETDYPHPSGLIPGEYTTTVKSPRDTILANLSTLPEWLLVNVLQDNAARVYGLSSYESV